MEWGMDVVRDRMQGVEPEEAVQELLRTMCNRPSGWQQVIHGDSFNYRLNVGLDLLGRGLIEPAKRFCLCGRGDQVVRLGDGFKLIPMRCGHRLCPRCARWRGSKYVRRCLDALRNRPSGYLHHAVFTQGILPGRSLHDTIECLKAKWLKFKGCARAGYYGGLRVLHVKWSERVGGWNAHYHCLFESLKEDTVTEMMRRWAGWVVDETGWCAPLFIRQLAAPGHCVVGEDDGDELLWSESKDSVTKCLQYVMRDVCEGPDKNIIASGSPAFIEELVSGLGARRMHEMLGSWRNLVDLEAEADEEVKEQVASLKKQEGIVLGTVDTVAKDASWWSRFSDWLVGQVGCNDTDYARRVRRFCGKPLATVVQME
jgi:hypothetical protein